jgi:CcmD family protein
MTMIRRLLLVFALLMLTAGPAAAQGGDKQWETVTQVPASEQLPAAPLVATAYGIVWLVPMVYLWAIWNRLKKVEQELKDLERRSGSRP